LRACRLPLLLPLLGLPGRRAAVARPLRQRTRREPNRAARGPGDGQRRRRRPARARRPRGGRLLRGLDAPRAARAHGQALRRAALPRPPLPHGRTARRLDGGLFPRGRGLEAARCRATAPPGSPRSGDGGGRPRARSLPTTRGGRLRRRALDGPPCPVRGARVHRPARTRTLPGDAPRALTATPSPRGLASTSLLPPAALALHSLCPRSALAAAAGV